MKKVLLAASGIQLLALSFFGISQAKSAPLSATITASNNLSCSGGNNGSTTVTASGGTSPYTYLWNPGGQTNATVTGLSVGIYTVTVTDWASNTATASVTITSPPQLVVTTFIMDTIFCNGSTGCAEFTATGGTAPYTYLWLPSGGTTDTVCGLSAGTYTVQVVDNNGCVGTATITMTQPTLLTAVTISTTNNTSCTNPNGSATANAAGGTFPYTYLWSLSAETNATATGLGADTYTCIVTDNNGCTATTTAIVSGVSIPTLSVTATMDTLPIGDVDTLIAHCSATATYVWQPGGATTDTLTVSPVVTTTYTVTAVTSCGTYTAVITVAVVPVPCTNNYDETICIVTLDTATNLNKVIWGRTNSPPATGSYNIYRDTALLGWVLIHNQPLNALSEYIDGSSTPNLGAESYKISTVDSCGESALSPIHTTIFLTTTASLNAYNLTWTAYVGFTPSLYRIFRGPSMSTLVQIDSVPNTVLTYTDSFPPLGSFYMLEAVNPSGTCIPTTRIKSRRTNFAELSGSCSNGFNTAILSVQSKGITSANVSVYPNPAKNILNVSFNGISSQADYYLTDILGRQVTTAISRQQIANGTKVSISTESLQPGVYFLTIECNGQKLVKKITKL